MIDLHNSHLASRALVCSCVLSLAAGALGCKAKDTDPPHISPPASAPPPMVTVTSDAPPPPAADPPPAAAPAPAQTAAPAKSAAPGKKNEPGTPIPIPSQVKPLVPKGVPQKLPL